MKHKIKYTIEDAADFSRVVKLRWRKYLGSDAVEFILFFLFWILIAIGLLILISFYIDAQEYRSGVNLILVYTVLVGLLIWGASARRISRCRKIAYSVDGFFLAEKEIEITDEGIFFTSKYVSNRYSYEAISDIVVSQKNIYLFVDNFQAIIIPKEICDEKQVASMKSRIRRPASFQLPILV